MTEEVWLAAQGATLHTLKSKTKSTVNAAAYGAGKQYGAGISLAPQVGASTSKAKMLK